MNSSLPKILNKKLIISVLTSSAFLTGLTLAVIWLYLSNIDRLDIFHDTESVKSIMGIILGFAIFSILGFSILLFVPSWMLIITFSSYERDIKKHDGIAHSFAIVGILNSLSSCLLLMITFSIHYFLNCNGYLTISLFLLSSTAISFWLANKNILKSEKYLSQDSSEEESILKKTSTKIMMPLVLLTPAIVQILPLSFLLKQLEFTEGSNDFAQLSLITMLSLMFAVLSILPGVIYINEKKSGEMLRSVSLILISISTILVVLSLIVRPIPNMIINMTMNLSGISDWRTHHFYIDNQIQHHTMFNGLLWNTRYYPDMPNRFFITGVNIFTLGNIQLICPTKITNARKESLKLTLDDMNEYDRKTKQLKTVAMECIPFNKNDIHTWDSPIPEPIYYEKIKTANGSSMLKILHFLK
ncbi:hypothetical protein AV650_06470 [Serratia fonticola]|nr:hypothetical protein AV650_06470 [Serratia fonticola]